MIPPARFTPPPSGLFAFVRPVHAREALDALRPYHVGAARNAYEIACNDFVPEVGRLSGLRYPDDVADNAPALAERFGSVFDRLPEWVIEDLSARPRPIPPFAGERLWEHDLGPGPAAAVALAFLAGQVALMRLCHSWDDYESTADEVARLCR